MPLGGQVAADEAALGDAEELCVAAHAVVRGGDAGDGAPAEGVFEKDGPVRLGPHRQLPRGPPADDLRHAVRVEVEAAHGRQPVLAALAPEPPRAVVHAGGAVREAEGEAPAAHAAEVRHALRLAHLGDHLLAAEGADAEVVAADEELCRAVSIHVAEGHRGHVVAGHRPEALLAGAAVPVDGAVAAHDRHRRPAPLDAAHEDLVHAVRHLHEELVRVLVHVVGHHAGARANEEEVVRALRLVPRVARREVPRLERRDLPVDVEKPQWAAAAAGRRLAAAAAVAIGAAAVVRRVHKHLPPLRSAREARPLAVEEAHAHQALQDVLPEPELERRGHHGGDGEAVAAARRRRAGRGPRADPKFLAERRKPGKPPAGTAAGLRAAGAGPSPRVDWSAEDAGGQSMSTR